MDMEKRQNKYEDLLYHIVLPRLLPQERPKDYEHMDLMLLSHLVDTVENSSEWIPSATVRLFQSLKRTHMNRTSKSISTEINALEPGNSFAMFVRRQNCALMVHMPKEEADVHSDEMKKVIVMTFPANLHPKEVYSHSSDLEVRKLCFSFYIISQFNNC